MPSEPLSAQRTRAIFQKVREIEIRTNRLVADAMGGEYHSVFKGRGMDFDEVREYAPGDEVRTIDWNVTARTGHPFVKKFKEERELTLLLALDASASGGFGSAAQSKREMAAELASVLAFSAARNRDRVGLVIFTDQVEKYIPPQKGRRHMLRLVREALFYEPQRTGTDLTEALRFINRVTRRQAIVFLISDFYVNPNTQDRALAAPLRLTNQRHDLIAAIVRDPREQTLPPGGLVHLEDSETGEQWEVDTASTRTRERFAQIASENHRAVEEALASAGVDTLKLDTSKPYVPELLRFFKNRERRRIAP